MNSHSVYICMSRHLKSKDVHIHSWPNFNSGFHYTCWYSFIKTEFDIDISEGPLLLSVWPGLLITSMFPWDSTCWSMTYFERRWSKDMDTVYPKKYAHGFVVLCFVVVMQSFIMNSDEVFIHIHQGCFAGTEAIVRLPQCQWSKPDGYGKISQCITTTKHSKAKTVCIFLGIYCMYLCIPSI